MAVPRGRCRGVLPTGSLRRLRPGALSRVRRPEPSTGTPRGDVTTDRAIQDAVRNAVLEVTGGDERLQVTHTLATLGWGGILFVDVYARSPYESFGELEPQLRTRVATVADQPYGRVAVRWRTSN
jgi:hypothetical protein